MAETQAAVAFGIILKKGGAAISDTYTDYGWEITSITPPGFSRAAIGATHMASPNGWSEAIMSGIKEQKPFTVELNWIVANTAALKTLTTGSMAWWQVLFPDGSSVKAKLGISDFSPGALTPDGKMSASVELTPTGEPTWA